MGCQLQLPFASDIRIYPVLAQFVICNQVVFNFQTISSFACGLILFIQTFHQFTTTTQEPRVSASRAFLILPSVVVTHVLTNILFIYVMNKPFSGSQAGATGQEIALVIQMLHIIIQAI